MSITITTAVGPVTAVEMFDGFRKGIDGQGGPQITKKYLVDWSQSDAFLNALMGVSSVSGGVNGTIFRVSPHRCPESANLWCLSCEAEGEGRPVINDGRPTWSHAVVTAIYGVQPWGQLNNDNTADPQNLMTPDQQAYPFCTFKFQGGVEMLAVPGGGYKFAAGPNVGGKVADSKILIRIGVASIVATVHFVPFLPFNSICSLRGKVNFATFLGQQRGTILFDEINSNQVINMDGTWTQDLEYTFRYRQVGWNTASDSGTASGTDPTNFYLITHDGTTGGHPPYSEADLRPLFFGCSLN
jgi:hypothetical protein